MGDAELAAIRAARLNQLQQKESGGAPGEGAGEDEAKRQNEEQMRRDMLATVLDSAARERRMLTSIFFWYATYSSAPFRMAVARIALVSPDRSRQMESILLRMAQTGQLRARVTEQQLIELLEQAEEANSKSSARKGAIVFQRRERDGDDDFDI
ncbi:hypothetical protein EWM64_g8392 [Hericium alpestre]|uniref:Programmed cell death protein 5 n=1 Tax=Hericium alpestre TaxID=135208 RepID=A0A4Y9ZQ98_9AGAM|nr:hypothetical protein EWM64_g8392 [Hericium alpestre]